MSDIQITKCEQTRHNTIDWDNLGFGKYFSDHMFVSDYKDGKWDNGAIVPYGPFQVEPANCTLHYGQSIFEGLKAFRTETGFNMFRPDMNAKRLNHSARRMCIPEYDVDHLLHAMQELCKVDFDFIPNQHGQALYLRPFVFGSGNFLGVHASDEYRLIVMTSPVASYYAEGLKPVRILVSDEFVRAVKGGTGSAKTAGNYAASLLAGKQANEMGCAQVLWLDAISRNFVDEVGAMNMMFVIGDELITPSLSHGTILNGVTRNSVLQLAEDMKIKASERAIGIDEIMEAHKSGNLKEAFGTGTAAVISPVGELNYKGEAIVINNMEIGPIAQKMYDTITGIQYGKIEDRHGWNVVVHM
jgi:branched-chain amino acid aminotransferase